MIHLGKIIIKRIILNFCFMTICKHILKNTIIIYRLNKHMDTLCHWFKLIRQFCDSSTFNFLTIFICYFMLHIYIAILNKIKFNSICSFVIYKCRNIIHFNILALKVFTCCNSRSVIKHSLNIRL